MSSYCDMRIGNEVFGDQMVFADSAFFDLFSFQLKYGSFEISMIRESIYQ